MDWEWIRPYLNSALYWAFIMSMGYGVFRIASYVSDSPDDDDNDD
jgi:hypothetical protein